MTTAICSVITALAFFIMPAPTTLYDADLNPIVTLPTGYFVLLRDAAPLDGYIAVAYDDLTGYVQSSSVTAVDYIPVNKYETKVKFVCDNDGQPVNLRAAPSKTAPVLTVLENAASGRCYGTVRGDTLIQGVGDTWYYVNANGLRGYCYSAHVRVDPTPPNVIEKEEEPNTPAVTDPEQPQDPQEPSAALPKYTAIIFIVVLCIPVPFIMFYLFKKPKSDDGE
ncbi:MAG: SH3 domain-containing protein [Clostridia bacterium]|nr:SH3 domain-containing protein [Clostridia bacterium]